MIKKTGTKRSAPRKPVAKKSATTLLESLSTRAEDLADLVDRLEGDVSIDAVDDGALTGDMADAISQCLCKAQGALDTVSSVLACLSESADEQAGLKKRLLAK